MGHEHLPPRGYVQALPVREHGDHIAEGVETVQITGFPTVIRALNLVREDNGGPSWPPVAMPHVAKAWCPHLETIEQEIVNLSDREPAWEDPEPCDGYLGSELYTFCNGESTVVEAMTRRSDGMRLAGAFLNDFFEGWALGVPD